MPRRVEVDAVDAPAAPVEGVQFRRVAVRFVGEARGVGAAEPRAVGVELRHAQSAPARASASRSAMSVAKRL